jgi:undecaprenyl-diphosphatase
MFTFFDAILLGIVEGLTEFLPISSTAHLILFADLLRLPDSDFLKSFEIAVQSGAILAVVCLYFKKFLDPAILKRLLIAFVPTGVVGLLLYGSVKEYLLDNTAVVLGALALGGILLIIFEKLHSETALAGELHGITYKQCVALGLFQSVAIVPGVSRAAATIVGGLLLQIPRRVIVEFSFLLAVPTMIAATGLDLVQSAGAFHPSQFGLLAVGFITSFVVAILGIRWLLGYIKKHDFTWFGVYRIALSLLFLLLAL